MHMTHMWSLTVYNDSITYTNMYKHEKSALYSASPRMVHDEYNN